MFHFFITRNTKEAALQQQLLLFSLFWALPLYKSSQGERRHRDQFWFCQRNEKWEEAICRNWRTTLFLATNNDITAAAAAAAIIAARASILVMQGALKIPENYMLAKHNHFTFAVRNSQSTVHSAKRRDTSG
jgi:hypothetical protein